MGLMADEKQDPKEIHFCFAFICICLIKIIKEFRNN